MSSRTIPVRLKDGDIEQVDMLVQLGLFNSRGEALRELIRIGVKSLKEVAEIATALRLLFKLEESSGDIPIRLPGALKQLLAERDRFP